MEPIRPSILCVLVLAIAAPSVLSQADRVTSSVVGNQLPKAHGEHPVPVLPIVGASRQAKEDGVDHFARLRRDLSSSIVGIPKRPKRDGRDHLTRHKRDSQSGFAALAGEDVELPESRKFELGIEGGDVAEGKTTRGTDL